MSTEFIGASIEQKLMPYWALFEVRKIIDEEIDERAWNYLKAIGYDCFRRDDINVFIIARGIQIVKIVKIVARFESNYKNQCVELEVPMKQFEMLSPESIRP